MAFTFYHELHHTANDWMFRLKELLVANGGVVLASGDGLAAYGASSDVCTVIQHPTGPTTTLANSFANNLAWARIRMPGGSGRPEVLLQHRTTGSSTWCAWVSQAGFSGGSPSATVRPTATDEFRILGSADTTGEEICEVSLSYYISCHLDACFGDVDENYAFYVTLRRVHTRNMCGLFADAVADPDAGDTNPYVFSWVRGTLNTLFMNIPTTLPADSSRSGFFWAANAEGNEPGYRLYGFSVPMEFQAEADPYGTYRYIGAPYYVRNGIQRSPATASNQGSVVKGKSRLFVGAGNGAAPEFAVITTPDSGLCLDEGRYILRWDDTSPRL